MEKIVNNHIKFLKHVINTIWISDGESLTKLYKMLDKSETELNELRGVELMINELLKEELKTVNDREQEGFQINSLQSADWAMRKLQAIEKHDQEVQEAAQADIDQTIAWRDRKLTENESSREYFHGLLKDYLYRERQHDSKFKIDTPHGKVTTRKTPSGLA